MLTQQVLSLALYYLLLVVHCLSFVPHFVRLPVSIDLLSGWSLAQDVPSLVKYLFSRLPPLLMCYGLFAVLLVEFHAMCRLARFHMAGRMMQLRRE